MSFNTVEKISCYQNTIKNIEAGQSMRESYHVHSFSSWRSSIWTNLSAHMKDFLVGSLQNRILFFGSAVQSSCEALYCTATLVRNLAINIIPAISSLTIFALKLEFSLVKRELKNIKNHFKDGVFPSVKENIIGLTHELGKTSNSVIGIAVPILAYWIDRTVVGMRS